MKDKIHFYIVWSFKGISLSIIIYRPFFEYNSIEIWLQYEKKTVGGND